MATIFNALNIGYSGLKSSQVAIDTTGHNIANAQNPDYTRQRVVIAPNSPLNTTPGDIGLGAKITEIVRIHDEFVYKRLKSSSSENEYASFRQSILEEISTYFPEVEKNGIYNSLSNYFDAWNSFSKNSDDSSLKIDLAQQTRDLVNSIKETRSFLQDTQDSLDEQLKTSIDEINRLGKEIAEINIRINTHESGGDNANDLRDQRDKLELALSKLINISVFKGELKQDSTVDLNIAEGSDQYHLNIGGSSFVDGSTFHPLVLNSAGDGTSYSNIYYQRQDYQIFDITNYINGGKVGAILSLRGSDYSQEFGKFMNGDIQRVIDKLDSFASSLIVNTNNIYASHSTDAMLSSTAVDPNLLVSNSTLPIDSTRQFKVKIYDINGSVVAERAIGLSGTFQDVVDDINRVDIDDNGDNTITNDVDDFIFASIDAQGYFSLSLKDGMKEQGYQFSIEEVDSQNPSLFAGALGLERFFDGKSAKDIDLNRVLDANPTLIGGNASPIAGDNGVANNMLQLQYQKVDFYLLGSKEPYSNDTLSGFFRMSVTEVASTTSSARASAETSESLLNAVISEFDSISRVDIDEELTNLMKYQTGYSASAKVITTIDQMIQTLLGIKQ